MSKKLDLPQCVKERRMFIVEDDFCWLISPHMWTTLAADTNATAAVAASGGAVGGTIVLHTGTVDNNEAAVATTNKPFLFADGKPAHFEALVQYAEAATSAANVAVGFGSVIGSADFLLDNGAGPAASWSGAIIYKVDGGTVWKTCSSNGTTQTITTSTTTAGGSSQQRLEIDVEGISSTTAEIVYKVDGVQLRDTNGNVIKDTILYASLVQMQAGVYAKQGSATTEDIKVDRIVAAQLR